MSDWELLEQFRKSRSEAAFRQLVERHVDFVYSSARRRVRDGHLAEDVTQVVFTVLARRAGDLKPGTPLKGWLFNAVKFASANQMRSERRRQQTEREAMAMAQTTNDAALNEQAWRSLDPYLEDGLARLRSSERNAILLRFFENRSVKEVGEMLAIGPNTAAKRISRGIAKLRAFFGRKGIVVPESVVESGLGKQVSPAPVGSAAAITAVAIASIKGTADRKSVV